MKWFRQKLQESSKKIQIVVFTCRPEDYLDENTKVGNESGPGQDQRARAVDLTKVLASVQVKGRIRLRGTT